MTPRACRVLVVLAWLAAPGCAFQKPHDVPSTADERASVELSAASGSAVHGFIILVGKGDGVLVQGQVTGLTPGPHGFHVHEKGDCSVADASSAGGHWNPTDHVHGSPEDTNHHAGDLGNLVADSTGTARIDRTFHALSLSGPNSIVGRALVVHENADDYVTQPAGNSGARVACGVVQRR